MQRLLNFWGVALYGKRQRGAGGARPAGLWFAAAATRRAARFLLWLAELLSAPFRCARLSKSAGRKPASIGCLRAGSLETRVEWVFQPWVTGNARKQWAGGQSLRKCPFYAGFGAGVVAIVVVGLWWCYGRYAAASGSTGDVSFPRDRRCKVRHCRSADSRSDALLLRDQWCAGDARVAAGCSRRQTKIYPRFAETSFFRLCWLVARGLRFTATRRTAHFSVAALPACDL